MRFKRFLTALGWGVTENMEASSPYKNLVGIDAEDPTRYLELTLDRFLRIGCNTEVEEARATTSVTETEQRGIFYFDL